MASVVVEEIQSLLEKDAPKEVSQRGIQIQDIQSVARLAEETQERTERYENALDEINYKIRMYFTLSIFLLGGAFYLYIGLEPGLHRSVSYFGIGWALAMWADCWALSLRFRATKRKRDAERRALYEVLSLLRELEPAAKLAGMNTLEQAELKMRLSRLSEDGVNI
jgi:hypothetical protein